MLPSSTEGLRIAVKTTDQCFQNFHFYSVLGQPNEGESCSSLCCLQSWEKKTFCLYVSQRLFCSLPRVAHQFSHLRTLCSKWPSFAAGTTHSSGWVSAVRVSSSEIKQLRIKQLLKGEGQFLGAALKKAEEEQRGSSAHWSRLHTSPLLSYEKSCLTTASWDQSMNKAGKSPVKMGGGFKCFSVRKRSSLCSVSCNLPKRLLFLVPPAVPFLTLHSPSWA